MSYYKGKHFLLVWGCFIRISVMFSLYPHSVFTTVFLKVITTDVDEYLNIRVLTQKLIPQFKISGTNIRILKFIFPLEFRWPERCQQDLISLNCSSLITFCCLYRWVRYNTSTPCQLGIDKGIVSPTPSSPLEIWVSRKWEKLMKLVTLLYQLTSVYFWDTCCSAVLQMLYLHQKMKCIKYIYFE